MCACVCAVGVATAITVKVWPIVRSAVIATFQRVCVRACVDCQISMNVMVPLASHVVFMEPVMVITHLVITPATATLATTPPTAILNAQVTFIPCIGRYEVTKT